MNENRKTNYNRIDMIKKLKARLTAKRIKIWQEERNKGESHVVEKYHYWKAADGDIYWGHPLFVFFKSSLSKILNKKEE